MHRLGILFRTMVPGLVLVLLIGGCSIYDQYFGNEEELSPEELMSEGLKRFETGNFEGATESFQKIKDRYPYSKFAIQAELKMADGLYHREEFDEAYDLYDEFERLHPKNKNIPYVIYQKGMSHFQQVSTIDRDQSHTLRAKEEFERLVRRFPGHDYANRARKNIRTSYISLAKYELYVGNFYFKMKKYRAALARYTYIVRNYPDMGQYQEALEGIKKSKEKLTKEEEKK